MKPYPPEVEETMRRFYNSLNEKDRQRYAGLEVLKCGHGGKKYIAQVLGCSQNTVSKGAIGVKKKIWGCLNSLIQCLTVASHQG